MAIIPAKILEVSDEDDPKEVVQTAIGDAFDDWTVLKNQVIVATAPAATKSKGGIIFTQGKMQESRFQGTVGLIVKLGEIAFNDEALWPSEETRPKVGDWVHYRASNTEEFFINKISCRYILDTGIHSVVPHPEGIE